MEKDGNEERHGREPGASANPDVGATASPATPRLSAGYYYGHHCPLGLCSPEGNHDAQQRLQRTSAARLAAEAERYAVNENLSNLNPGCNQI
jgi:hypothetical protein